MHFGLQRGLQSALRRQKRIRLPKDQRRRYHAPDRIPDVGNSLDDQFPAGNGWKAVESNPWKTPDSPNFRRRNRPRTLLLRMKPQPRNSETVIARDVESFVASHAPTRDVGPSLRISQPARPNTPISPPPVKCADLLRPVVGSARRATVRRSLLITAVPFNAVFVSRSGARR